MTEVQEHLEVDSEFLADIEPVLKRDSYGYHSHQRIFLKIHTYAPRTIARIATIVAQGGLSEELVPRGTACYAAHIPFVMQTLVDQGLAGMAYANFSRARFRRPLPDGGDAEELFGRASGDRMFVRGLEKLKPELFWPFQVAKRSTSKLEIDVFVNDILNGGLMEGEYAFVSKTLAVLWEEERLRTGTYPPRQKPAERTVKAGAHLADSGLREQLEKVMATDSQEASHVPEEVAEGLLASQRSIGSVSLPATYDDVLNVLDACAPYADSEDDMSIEEFEDEVDEILDPEFEDGVAHVPFHNQKADEQNVIAKTWADIAACSQTMSGKSEEGNTVDQDDAPQPKVRRTDGRVANNSGSQGSVFIDEVEEYPRSVTPDLARTKKHTSPRLKPEVEPSLKQIRIPKEGQWFTEAGHGLSAFGVSEEMTTAPLAVQKAVGSPINDDEIPQSGEPDGLDNMCHISLRPKEKPPSCSALMRERELGDAFTIRYTTPFYGDKEDEVEPKRAVGGLIIPVRGSGPAGYPPFPLYFDNTKIEVEILPRVVRPSEPPPTLSRLTRELIHASEPSDNSAEKGKQAIDSAGRQVYYNGTSTIRDSQIFSFDPAVDFMSHITERRDFPDSCDGDSDSSENNGLATPKGKPSQQGSIKTDDTLVQNRPLSPKYDEGFQQYVLPNQGKKKSCQLKRQLE